MIDYHLHSANSGDASQSYLDACHIHSTLGTQEICFTDHMDFEPTDPCYQHFDYTAAREELKVAQNAFESQMHIGFGVEIDFQTKYASQFKEFLQNHEFDYVVGSVHYVHGILLENHDLFFPGKTADEAYTPYFENVMQMLQVGGFDTVAHLDICKRHGSKYFGEFKPDMFRGQIEAILQTIIKMDLTLEINTSGLRQSPGDIYPCREILEWYYNMGGRCITIGSDAHHLDQTGFGISQGIEIARSIGFDALDTYRERKRIKRMIY